jgi:hypothetical protein
MSHYRSLTDILEIIEIIYKLYIVSTLMNLEFEL